jgi:uncharacterized protein (DUF169 family)
MFRPMVSSRAVITHHREREGERENFKRKNPLLACIFIVASAHLIENVFLAQNAHGCDCADANLGKSKEENRFSGRSNDKFFIPKKIVIIC